MNNLPHYINHMRIRMRKLYECIEVCSFMLVALDRETYNQLVVTDTSSNTWLPTSFRFGCVYFSEWFLQKLNTPKYTTWSEVDPIHKCYTVVGHAIRTCLVMIMIQISSQLSLNYVSRKQKVTFRLLYEVMIAVFKLVCFLSLEGLVRSRM